MKKLRNVLLMALSMIFFMGCAFDHVTMDNLQEKLKSEANVTTKKISINTSLLGVDELDDAYLLEDEDGHELIVGKLSDGTNLTTENVGDSKVGDVIGSNAVVHNGYVYRISESYTNYKKCKEILEKLGQCE